ncbi:MAG: hypothetical protein E7Y34_00385 [Mycoplasma sp.]|nr:hypothetical protein [Mycoplasma sp.]
MSGSSGSNSNTSFIILGIVVLVIVFVLIITAILDRRKEKFKKKQEKELEELIQKSKDHIVIFLSLLINYNDRFLIEFKNNNTPLKMNQIKTGAKACIEEFIKSESFQIVYKENKLDKIATICFDLKKENCTLWKKNHEKNIQYLTKLLRKLDIKSEDNASFISLTKQKIKDIYKEHTKWTYQIN